VKKCFICSIEYDKKEGSVELEAYGRVLNFCSCDCFKKGAKNKELIDFMRSMLKKAVK